MTEQIDKDRSILGLLSRLHTELGAKAFDVVDHWDSDLCAIGLAMPADHATLIYVSSYGHPDGEFDYELENAPTTAGDVYSVAGRGNATYVELLGIIRTHLKIKE